MLSAIDLVLLHDQRPDRELAVVVLLDGLGSRERVPIEEVPAASDANTPNATACDQSASAGPNWMLFVFATFRTLPASVAGAPNVMAWRA